MFNSGSPSRSSEPLLQTFYRELHPQILRDIEQLESNWRTGHFQLQKIPCRSQNSKGVYCLQYDEEKVVSGLRDNTIRIWDIECGACLRVLEGHDELVRCIRFDS